MAPQRGTFIISDAESITGVVGYIAKTSPWLRFMMSFLYTSIVGALKAAKLYLIHNSRDFRVMLKAAKTKLKNTAFLSPKPRGTPAQLDTELRHRNFAASKAAKQVQHSRQAFRKTEHLEREIKLIYCALTRP